MVSLVALSGSFILFLKAETLQRSLQFLVSLSVGVLLGDAFLHLLPDAIQKTGNVNQVMLYTLGGIFLFFLLEKAIRWRHHHEIFPETGADQVRPLAKMNLLGDAVHNFIDGCLIAGSFMVSPVLGFTTTLAIIIHEIPQEIGDIGALIYGGYSPKKAIWYNFLCSLTCLAGVLSILLIAPLVAAHITYVMPIAAGGFIYIATCDLIPELHRKTALKHQFAQSFCISIGIFAMFFVGVLEKIFGF